MATQTKNRRTAKPKTAKPRAKKVVKTDGLNPIVLRRLAFLGRADLAKVATRYQDGESVATFADEHEVSTTQASYAVRQAVVEANPSMKLDIEDPVALAEVVQNGDRANAVWIACRAGVTNDRARKAIEALTA